MRVVTRYFIRFPYWVKTPTNQTGRSWNIRYARTSAERKALNQAFKASGSPKPPLPVVITFTRISKRFLDEGDNLPNAFKAMRDELCKLIGTNDHPRSEVTFRYKQRKPEKHENNHTVEIEMVHKHREGTR